MFFFLMTKLGYGSNNTVIPKLSSGQELQGLPVSVYFTKISRCPSMIITTRSTSYKVHTERLCLFIYLAIHVFCHRHILFRSTSQHTISHQLPHITAQMISSTLAIGNYSVRQSVGESLLSANRSSGQDQIEGSGQTNEMRKTHGAPIDQGNS